MRRTIITLTLTLTAFSFLFGQSFKKDIGEGLYLWSSGMVIQQIKDTLTIVQLRMSKTHLYKVADVVYDSIAKTKMLPQTDPMWAMIKRNDTYRLIKPTRIIDIIEISKSRFSIIFPAEKGFNSANFVKRDYGYEMYLSNHDVKRRDVKAAIVKDTTAYFMLYAFTLPDLETLMGLRKFDDISQTEFETLRTSIITSAAKYEKLLKENMTFGIEIEGYKVYGIIEVYELMIKGLLKLRYNPLIDPSELDVMSKKYGYKR